MHLPRSIWFASAICLLACVRPAAEHPLTSAAQPRAHGSVSAQQATAPSPQLLVPVSAAPAFEEPRDERAGPQAPPADGIRRCAPNMICVPPVSDALEACRAAISLLRFEESYSEPSECHATDQRAHARKGDIRTAALVDVDDHEFGHRMVLMLASERGFDRMLEFFTWSEPLNGAAEVAFSGLRFSDVLPGGEPELRVDMKSHAEDVDCMGEYEFRVERTDFGFCSLSGTTPFCVAPIPQTRRAFFVMTEAKKPPPTPEARYRMRAQLSVAGISLRGNLPEQLQAFHAPVPLESASEQLVRAFP